MQKRRAPALLFLIPQQKAVRVTGQLSFYLQVADYVQQFAQLGHTLDEILLHRHIYLPPN